MAELECARLHELGPELALGVLSGRERAQAVAHLQDCPSCEQHVRELSVIGDRLVLLAPSAEPPVGFEQRVLDRLGLPERRRPWRRRWVAAAALLLALGLAAGGWVLHATLDAERGFTSVASNGTTAALTDEGTRVGEVFLYSDRRSWLYVEVSSPKVSGTVLCQARLTDGRTVTVGTFPVSAGTGQWAVPAPVTADRLAEVRLLAEDGSIVGAAHLR